MPHHLHTHRPNQPGNPDLDSDPDPDRILTETLNPIRVFLPPSPSPSPSASLASPTANLQSRILLEPRAIPPATPTPTPPTTPTNMRDLQWPKLENFIPRDLLEHIRLLRSNFAKINLHVKESPVGAVPNYYYNVLSQQYMDLSEKLLAPTTEDELTALGVRAKAHVATLLGSGAAAQGEEEAKEVMIDVRGRREIMHDEAWSRAENESSRGRENALGSPSSERISSPLQENNVIVPTPDPILSQPRRESVKRPISRKSPSLAGEKAVDVPGLTRSPDAQQENVVDAGDIHTVQGHSQELEVSSIPLDIDLENDPDREIHVAIPALASRSTMTDRITPENPLEAYAVEMLNVHTAYMHIGTRFEKVKARKKLIRENQPRVSALRDQEDIKNIEWISNDSPKKEKGSIILEFRTPEQANEVIKTGLDWYGFGHSCQKYARNCKQRQCTVCQVYGHSQNQCTSLPRCRFCSGQHSASDCFNSIELCALCGGEHSADSPVCPKLAAEKKRVSDTLLNWSCFWPVQGAANSRATQRPVESIFREMSRADRLSSTTTEFTNFPDLSYEGVSAQSSAKWPTVWQPQDVSKSKEFATCPLKSGTRKPSWYPSGQEKTAKKAVKAVSGNRAYSEKRIESRKTKTRRSSSTGQQDRAGFNGSQEPPPSNKKSPAAPPLAMGSWYADAADGDW